MQETESLSQLIVTSKSVSDTKDVFSDRGCFVEKKVFIMKIF